MAFLVVAGVTLPVVRGQFERQPDGLGGKSKWVGTTAPLTRADEATLRAAAGTPSGADSDRAEDGTLHTDRALVTASGEAFGATEGASATVSVEVTITSAAARYWHAGDGTPISRNALALTLREG